MPHDNYFQSFFSSCHAILGNYNAPLTLKFNDVTLTKKIYDRARVHPNLIPIGVIMVHFSTSARPCVHPMTCASQMGEARARCVIKKLLQRDNTIKKVHL